MNKTALLSALLVRAHPGTGVEHWLQRQMVRTTVWLLRNSPYILDWYPSLDDSLMRRILEAHPRICEKVARPYQRCGLSYAERHRLLIGHYCWLRTQLSEAALTAIFLGEGLELACLSVEGAGEHRLVLRYLSQFEMEGDLTLSLERVDGQRTFCMTFSMLEDEQGMSMHIGGVQGGAGDIGEMVRQLTKAWHGMRPKALMLSALMQLASSWGVAFLSGVGGDSHVYHSLSFKRSRKDRIQADYDSLWLDAGGGINADKPSLYALPLVWPMRPMDKVSTHKRAMYRRRYAMLGKLAKELEARARTALNSVRIEPLPLFAGAGHFRSFNKYEIISDLSRTAVVEE